MSDTIRKQNEEVAKGFGKIASMPESELRMLFRAMKEIKNATNTLHRQGKSISNA